MEDGISRLGARLNGRTSTSAAVWLRFPAAWGTCSSAPVIRRAWSRRTTSAEPGTSFGAGRARASRRRLGRARHGSSPRKRARGWQAGRAGAGGRAPRGARRAGRTRRAGGRPRGGAPPRGGRPPRGGSRGAGAARRGGGGADARERRPPLSGAPRGDEVATREVVGAEAGHEPF